MTHIMDNYGLVFGDNNEVVGWHLGLDEPQVIARTRNDLITGLAYRDGSLFEGTYEGIVRNTKTRENIFEVPTKTEEGDRHRVCSLTFQGMSLLVAYRKPGAKGRDWEGATIADVFTGEELITVTDSDKFRYRPSIIDLAGSDDELYLSSSGVGVIKVFRFEPLIPHRSDRPCIATNGEITVMMSYMGENSHPDGPELNLLPTNKRLAYWSLKEKTTFSHQGYPYRLAFIDDVVVFGSKIFDMGSHLYAFKLTQRMFKNETGALVRPKLLLKNAYFNPQFSGIGNPLLALPLEDVCKLLE